VKIFDGNYLFSTPLYAPSAYFDILTGAFVVMFLAGAFFNWRRSKLAGENAVLRRFIRRASKSAMTWAIIGLIFALFRYGGIDYLAPPIWMYLVLLGIVITIGYFVYDYSEHYPVAVWQLEQSHLERRFRPVSKPRPEPQRVRPKQRGKRKN
jgi:Na+-transporting NADH:ubiquinone oxidoreductase subunit NqrB